MTTATLLAVALSVGCVAEDDVPGGGDRNDDIAEFDRYQLSANVRVEFFEQQTGTLSGWFELEFTGKQGAMVIWPFCDRMVGDQPADSLAVRGDTFVNCQLGTFSGFYPEPTGGAPGVPQPRMADDQSMTITAQAGGSDSDTTR